MRNDKIALNVYQPEDNTFNKGILHIDGDKLYLSKDNLSNDCNLYLSPGWIDMHTHVYVGGGQLGIEPDRAGIQHGVHLLVDAGSAGVSNIGAFRDHVAPAAKTKIKAFLNISSIGLASEQPYLDKRHRDVEKTARCIMENANSFLIGVKVLASRLRVEEAGMEPLKEAVKAAEIAGCPVMAHLAEGPPYNDETMPLLRKNDIISHCFHGDKYRTERSNIMWNADGSPIKPLKEALERGVILDVAHGSASLSADIARSVVQSGMQDFVISTDLHSRNINGPVFSLAETMGKFLAFGMELNDVVRAVTIKPAEAIGIRDWGEDPCRRSTIFRLRKSRDTDPELKDALGKRIPLDQRVEPVAVIENGIMYDLAPDWR